MRVAESIVNGMRPDFTSISITELIPQRPPMVLVDALLHCEHTYAETAFTVPVEGVFVTHGALTASGLVENMAQTTAARIGYLALYGPQAGETIRIGVIGAVKRLEINYLPTVGSLLHTRVDLLEEWGDMILAKLAVQEGGQLCASCEMLVSLL